MSQIEREKQRVAEWIKAGFTLYAPRFSDAGGEWGIPSATEVEEYGKEFSSIILDSEHFKDVELPNLCDLVKLRKDLNDLIERGCPALTLVELMLVCTNGFRFTLRDGLHLTGITDKILRDLKRNLRPMCAGHLYTRELRNRTAILA
jgi:hypothetical protein